MYLLSKTRKSHSNTSTLALCKVGLQYEVSLTAVKQNGKPGDSGACGVHPGRVQRWQESVALLDPVDDEDVLTVRGLDPCGSAGNECVGGVDGGHAVHLKWNRQVREGAEARADDKQLQ